MTDLHEQQQINLLDRGGRAGAVVLPAQYLLVLALLFAAALLAYYFVQRSGLAALQDRVARLEADYSLRQADLGGGVAARPKGGDLAELDRRIARLTKERRAKGHVLNLLAGPSLGSTAGFSPYLEGLARLTRRGVWLRHIAIRDGGGELSLTGSALDPRLVPRYLKRLSGQPPYTDIAFRSFKMERRAGTPAAVDFTVKTAAPGD